MLRSTIGLRLALTLAFGAALGASPVAAQSAAASTASQPVTGVRLVMLGTMAGPMATADRAQPSTLLQWSGGAILVDAGDGVVDQMAKARIDPVKVRTIVLTHIHADHVGGLFALLARRYQLMDPPVTIYGPP